MSSFYSIEELQQIGFKSLGENVLISRKASIYGAEKITAYLGQYLTEHYEIDTSHTEEVAAEWEHCASCNEEIIGMLKEVSS